MKTEEPYKILFISHVLDSSGAPRSLLLLLKHIPRSEYIDIYLLGLRRDELRGEFEKVIGKPVIVITENPPRNKLLKLVERIITIPKIFYYLWKINPDLVFVNSAANSRAILISKLLGYKTYVFVREYEDMFVSLANFRKRFIRLADKVFVTNEAHEAWVKDRLKYKGRTAIIPNGIDLKEVNILLQDEPDEQFLEFVKKHNFIIANIGYMSLRKGWDYFLEVIKSLKEYKDIGFLIIGDFIHYEEKDHFIRNIREEKMSERLFITGLTSNIYRYLKYADAVSITSRSEAFPRVALESIAIGKPVVFFNVGGISSIFPESYKYKVKPFDIQEYVSCLLEIYHMEKTESDNLKSLLKERAKYFDIRTLSSKFYKEILPERRL